MDQRFRDLRLGPFVTIHGEGLRQTLAERRLIDLEMRGVARYEGSFHRTVLIEHDHPLGI